MHGLDRYLRLAFGGALSGSTAGWQFVALYNDSVGAHVLRPYAFDNFFLGGNWEQVALVQGTVGALVGKCVAGWAGHAAPPGAMYNGVLAAAPTGAQYAPCAVYGGDYRLPPFILEPGWSLLMGFTTVATSAQFQAGVFYEWMGPE